MPHFSLPVVLFRSHMAWASQLPVQFPRPQFSGSNPHLPLVPQPRGRIWVRTEDSDKERPQGYWVRCSDLWWNDGSLLQPSSGWELCLGWNTYTSPGRSARSQPTYE